MVHVDLICAEINQKYKIFEQFDESVWNVVTGVILTIETRSYYKRQKMKQEKIEKKNNLMKVIFKLWRIKC